MANPSRLTSGVATVTKSDAWGMYIAPAPTKVHQFFEDFDYYTAADWTVTEVGTATQALTDVDGGALLITNAANDDDSSFSQKVGESFKFESGKKLWFEVRLKTNDATQSDIVAGLQITDTTPLDVTDGVFFLKSDGAATVNLLVEKNNTATTTSSVATMANDTFIRLAYYYNGSDEIQVFADNVLVATSATTNLPDDEELTVSFGIQNGAAAAKTLTVDYIFVAKER